MKTFNVICVQQKHGLMIGHVPQDWVVLLLGKETFGLILDKGQKREKPTGGQ